MSSSEKILKMLSTILENGILTSKDAKKEVINNLKFERDKLVDKLNLVSRDELDILKKLIEKQQKELDFLKKKLKFKKAKKS
tara:strand:+ start:129 stop:374 length:246 start_codon:yes stop_codon:yes gene_type:complete